MPDTLADEIRRSDPAALATTQRSGAAALPALKQTITDEDPEARIWTLRCAGLLGGPEASDLAMSALRDPDIQVASEACRVLHQHPPKGRAGELYGAFASQPDVTVRSEIAKVAGRVGGEPEIKVWTTALPFIEEDQAREAVLTALARMGHQPSRDWFKTQLAGADGPRARDWLEDAEYMDDQWVLPTLATLLGRRTTVYTSSADFKPVDIRVCDLAAHAIFVIAKPKVEFPVSRRRFLETELEEARKAAQPKSP